MKLNSKRGEYFQFLRKSFFVMRITLYFILLSSAFAFSSNSYAQDAKLSLQMNNAAVKEVLNAIEDQSEFIFFYQDQQIDLNRKVNIVVEKKSVQEILDQLFVGTTNVYMIKDRQITIGRSQKLMVNKDLSTESFSIEEQQQQKREISGTVKDSKGQPLPGVSVVVKGTTTGTITDSDGKFSLTVPADAKTLAFSFVGMKTQEIVFGNKSSINLVLEEETTAIEEVIAVGYGTQKKVSLTGAISYVRGSDLIVTKNENVMNMLAGKMSGVRVVQSTGEPGDFASTIQIRGLGTPLVIIDGVPRDNMSRLNPNEIESISVLKDASAAIYGVRAANGVILITTKKGDKGKLQLEYSGYYGVQTPIRTPKGLDAAQYMELTNENNIMRGSLAPGTLLFPLATIEDYRSGKKQGTEWSRINSNYYAPQYQHNISASGNNENINYFVNFGNFRQEGIYKSGDLNYERYNFRSNVSGKINKNLKIELLISGMADTKNSPYGSDNREQYWRNIWVLKPTIPAYANYNPDYIQETLQGNNPLVTTNSNFVGYDRANEKLIQTTGNLIWDIPWIKGLQAKGSYSYDYTFWENKSLQKSYSLYQYDLSNDAYVPSVHGNTTLPGSSAITRSTRFSKNTLL